MKARIFYLCIVFLFLFSRQGASQTSIGGVPSQLVQSYFDAVNSFSPLYLGKAVTEYGREIAYPYLVSTDYSKGNIWFDGIYYSDVLLRLDFSKQELSVLPPQDIFGVILSTDYMGEVSLHGYKIVYISKNSIQGFSGESGYYIEFYRSLDGSVRGLHSITKKSFEVMTSGVVRLDFVTYNKYYVERDGRFFEIRNKRNLLKCFSEQQKDLLHFMKVQDIRYSDNPVFYITKVLEQVKQ